METMQSTVSSTIGTGTDKKSPKLLPLIFQKGETVEREPGKIEGYLLKKRKRPLKGWHKVCDGNLLSWIMVLIVPGVALGFKIRGREWPLNTVVWNDYLLIFWPNVIFYYTRSWKPNANNQICWITKVSTHSKTLIQFCWKFIYFKDVYWWFLKIWICDKMRAPFIFQIIDYAWISIMLFDLCWKW